MDGGGLRPRSLLGDTKPAAKPRPPRFVGVGTLWEPFAFPAPPRALSLLVSMWGCLDSEIQCFAGMESEAISKLTDLCDSCKTILESRLGAKGEQIRVCLEPWLLRELES